MHKILNRLTKTFAIFPQKFCESEVRLFASFAHKDFAYDSPTHGQFTTRLLRHLLVEKTDERPVITKDVKFSELYPVHREQEFIRKINGLATDQLARSIVYASIYKNGCQPADLAFVLNNLDNMCTRRLDELDLAGVLQILNAFMYVIPEKLVRLDFYRQAMVRLADLFAANPNLEDFLKACFYLGCWKKDKHGSELMEKFLDQHLTTYLGDELTTTDFAVICHAAFKTSMKLANNKAFRRRLEAEIVTMADVDDSLMVTFIKSARLVRLNSADITEKLRSMVMGETEFRFVGLVHILTYFADNLINDVDAVQALVKKCATIILSANKPWRGELNSGKYSLDEVRGKDLANFLWACAHLNLDNALTDEQLKEIAKIVEYKIECQEYDYRHNELIDTILSLWQLNHRCQDLVVTMLTSRVFNRPANVDKFKLETRKHLLINAVDIEAPEILRHCHIKRSQTVQEDAVAPDYLVKSRKGLQQVHRVLAEQQEALNVKAVKCVAQIRHLNVAGLLVETNDNRRFHVEVLEDGLVLSDQVTPMGVFALKMRLLKASGYQTITVNTKLHATDEEVLKNLEEQIFQLDDQKLEKAVGKVRKFQ